jgi:hypothetical protein
LAETHSTHEGNNGPEVVVHPVGTRGRREVREMPALKMFRVGCIVRHTSSMTKGHSSNTGRHQVIEVEGQCSIGYGLVPVLSQSQKDRDWRIES